MADKKERQETLRSIIQQLHDGESVEDVKSQFQELIAGVSTSEIAEMEQALVAEGLPVEEIQRLCDVHASVFQGSISDIHRLDSVTADTFHPIRVFQAENQALRSFIKDEIEPYLPHSDEPLSRDQARRLAESFSILADLDTHYARKENLLFPIMEREGVTTPPKVMWGVDDEIRGMIKSVLQSLRTQEVLDAKVTADMHATLQKVVDMIDKEESILFPMVLETFSDEDWQAIADSSAEFGFFLIEPPERWRPANDKPSEEEPEHAGRVAFDAGALEPDTINAIFNTLPVDVTFVDAEGIVRFCSQTKDQAFPRPKTIIGRQVEYCHPPASVERVQAVVDDLRAGRRDSADFWIHLGEKYVYIRYFAVRGPEGDYLGTMEVTQDIRHLQTIEGERRLLDE